MGPWVPLDLRGNQDEGDGPVLMAPEGCRGRLEPRVTVGLTAWLVCLVRKDTEVKVAPTAPQVPQERMERGETMERSGPGVCLASLDPVVCWDPKGLRAPLDPLA